MAWQAAAQAQINSKWADMPTPSLQSVHSTSVQPQPTHPRQALCLWVQVLKVVLCQQS